MKTQRFVRLVVAVTSILVLRGSMTIAFAASESFTLFKTKCSSCHTFGNGDRVGPDLKGVTDRRSRQWLRSWIKSSETLIGSGDPSAQALFRQYRQQRMPDHDLSDEQITALLDFLAAGGPVAQQQPRMRLAAEATPQEIELGRQLFLGEARFTNGAVACVFCHALVKQTLLGGSLAPDLSGAFTRYFDSALEQRLKRPCVLAATDPGVIDSESLALRAFLRSLSAGPSTDHRSDGKAADNRTSSSR